MRRLLAILVWICSCTLATDTRAEYVALVVGVEDYSPTALRPLNYAEDDATSLASRLELMGFHVILMTGSQKNPDLKPSTPEKILNALKGRLKGLEKGDTLIVAMTGHGVQFTAEPKQKTGARETYFCPESARVDDKSTLLPLGKEVLSRIDSCPAGRKLVLIDACRNDISPKAGDLAAKSIPIDSVNDNPRRLPAGMSVLFSCSGGEKSWEHDSLRGSVFSNFVLEYLSGRGAEGLYNQGRPDIDGLVTYVRRMTNRFVVDEITPSGQLPELVGDRESWPIATGTTADSFTNTAGMKLIRIEGGTLKRDYEPTEVAIPTLLVAKKRVTVGDFKQFVSETGYRTVAELAADGEAGKLAAMGIARASLEGRGIEQYYGLWWNEAFDTAAGSTDQNRPFRRDKNASWKKLSWPQTDQHPVINLSPTDVQAYSDWLSKKEGRSYRIFDDQQFAWVAFGDLPDEYAPHGDSGPPNTLREKRVWGDLEFVLAARPPQNPLTAPSGSSYFEVVGDYGWGGESYVYGTVTTARRTAHPHGLVGLTTNFPEFHSNSYYPENNTADCSSFFTNGVCYVQDDLSPKLVGFRMILEP